MLTDSVAPGQEEEAENQLFKKLTQLSQRHVNTEFQHEEMPLKSIPFTAADWTKVKKIYTQWRDGEIKEGNFIDKCPDIPEGKSYGDPEYEDMLYKEALPPIPKQFNRDGNSHYDGYYLDTLMADINFDGKPDVVFKIDRGTCDFGSASAGAPIPPTIYLTLLSKNDEYLIDTTGLISNIADSIHHFNLSVGDGRSHPELSFIRSISTKNGMVLISGTSGASKYTHEDPACCPSFDFRYTFHYYINKNGKGYAEIDGIYNDTQQFKIKLPYR
ncbi:MAG: hypothetical protein LBE91_15585 [Tannerella sp.]|jgi:hypothetical protein|nr:hypothetical protein [Tannerella sp.]